MFKDMNKECGESCHATTQGEYPQSDAFCQASPDADSFSIVRALPVHVDVSQNLFCMQPSLCMTHLDIEEVELNVPLVLWSSACSYTGSNFYVRCQAPECGGGEYGETYRT